MTTNSRILQFFVMIILKIFQLQQLLQKIFSFLAGVVSNIFAIENALQLKIHFLSNVFEKSYLLRHLTIAIAHKNLILEIGYTYYANSLFLPRSIFYNFFPMVNCLKTYCA